MLEDDTDIIAKINSAEEVVADDEKFRKKLGIGADAYRSLKAISTVSPAAAGAGGAVVGAAVASSSLVAPTFFGGTAATVAGWLGLGLTATTPVGWILAAGAVGAVATGGAYVGYSKLRKKLIDEVPRHLNAPLDVLASSVIGFLMPVAVRLALSDGSVHDRERRKIKDYFVAEWGYSGAFVDRKLEELRNKPDSVSQDELFPALQELKSHEKDCNFDHIFRELLSFLEELANADGEFHLGEKSTIDEVRTLLHVHDLLPSGAS